MAKSQRTKTLPRLFFDIETVGMKDVESWVPEPKIDARVKDPDKIAAQREEKIAEAVERAGLDADLGVVRLISMQVGVTETPTILLVPSKKMPKAKASAFIKQYEPAKVLLVTETEAIVKFWGNLTMCNGCSVGYNTMGFDLPFLMRRSMDLGIQPGITPAMAKYRAEPTTDLMGLLFNWSWGENVKKLKWVAKRYGLEILAEEVDGSMVASMSDDELLVYGLSDLWVTVQLYQKMNGIYFNHQQYD